MNIRKIYYSTFGGVHKNMRLTYQLRMMLRMLVPGCICRRNVRKAHQALARMTKQEQEYVMDRVNYYCRIPADVMPLTEEWPTLAENNFRKSNRQYRSPLAQRKHRLAGPLPFFFDSYEVTRCFPQHLRWNIEGGDVNTEMSVPTITKSRLIPAGGTTSMNVLLNLNRVRHFVFFNDPFQWEQKAPKVIFRGVVAHKPRRQLFLDMWADHPMCDLRDATDMTLYDHLQYRYITALEGNDVASNLKWVMSSNSIAVMPRPTCETWFMEGRLIPGYHYIEIADDYHDLMEKIDYYEAHPEEAEAIIANAHAWVRQFFDSKSEHLISLLVMEKYLTAVNA